MHRFLVSNELLKESSPTLPRDAANHLKVVRVKDGEEIELFDGRGSYRRYAYNASRLAPVASANSIAASSLKLTLFACITKGSRWDWTLEKATEIGVTRIVPVVSERTIVRVSASERAAKRERYMRIVEDAVRQSGSYWAPEVLPPTDFAEAVKLAEATTGFVGALMETPPKPLAEAVQATKSQNLSVFIGPEGDFTPEELARLLEKLTPVSLGPTVLRAETASIYAISVIKAVAARA